MNSEPFNMIKNWWPVVAWMSLIFLFSTGLFSGANTSSFLGPILSSLFPAMTGDQIEIVHLTVRKLGHWGEYFILAILCVRALHAHPPRQSRLRRTVIAIAIATLYATSDEWHQSFVPSRSASIIDMLIDSFGAICGTLWFERRQRD
ncbi:MAG: putative rane protein [Deltaproteobacteria bacterium]|nr:putative rane protein [Deltaproteobacteria bacterium]